MFNDSPLKYWIMASRPKTLPAAIAPVFLGTAMAFGDGVFHIPTAFVALFAAIMIQIGTNFANDYFDFKKGADTASRIGPTRVTQAGLISPKAMQCAMIMFFSLAALAAIWLSLRAGWPIAVLGVLCIASGILYTAGPLPLGYIGLGELFVLIFFGPIAVAGTYYVQSFELHAGVILAGFSAGLISSAVLVVNNLRDIESDRHAGKKTLAARFGPAFAKSEYFFFIVLAGLIPVLIYTMIHDHLYILCSAVTILLAFPGIFIVFTKTDGPSLSKALSFTGIVLIMFSIIFSIGWIL